MWHKILLIILGFISFNAAKTEEVSYTSSDGTKIFADLNLPKHGKNGPLILLFHQAGASGKAEYQNVTPILLEHGYSTLAVDLRSGGDRFNGVNKTVTAFSEDPGYCAAYPDLLATLKYLEKADLNDTVFAVGSSYSAALVIHLGDEFRKELKGIIAFSPASGGPMAACNPNQYAETIKTPLMVVRPDAEMEYTSVQQQFTLFKQQGHKMFIHEGGVHGASTLDQTRTGTNTDPVWAEVLSFLKINIRNERHLK
jgi:pimeloyl-ACP methyl ester carboxylesterase